MLTVTTAATNSKLVDVAVARTMLGIDGSGEDAALNGYIDRASDVIARHCNRVFGLEIVSEQFRLDRLQEELILNRYPVVGDVTVVEDGNGLRSSWPLPLSSRGLTLCPIHIWQGRKMPQNRKRRVVTMPKNVHTVISRGREYFYFQEGRGTDRAGQRVRLPNDPQSPEFWQAIRQAQGLHGVVAVDTFGAVLDAYETSPAMLKLTPGTQDQYKRALRIGREAWGNLSIKGLRPVHVQAVMDGLAKTPGKGNNFLSAMRAFSTWARVRDHIEASLTEGVKPYAKDEGHKPWSHEQISAAVDNLTGVIRKGVVLYLYTGMRGSDAVRLGWTHINEGGFDLKTQKRKRDVWCPIVPELSAEMAKWEKRPGPFLLQEGGRAHGKPYTRKLFSTHFAAARDKVPALAGVTLHGLRATAVIRLRRAGLSTGQIGDIVGMSLAMIERYCRFADRKTGGQAALITLKRTSAEQNCKTLKNGKTKA